MAALRGKRHTVTRSSHGEVGKGGNSNGKENYKRQNEGERKEGKDGSVEVKPKVEVKKEVKEEGKVVGGTERGNGEEKSVMKKEVEKAGGGKGREINNEKSSEKELEVGTKLPCLCSWKESEYLDAEVVEKRRGSKGWEYYVHYVHCNRRLDEWVPAERFDFSKLTDGAPSVTQVGDLSEIAKKSTRKTVKKGLKRKASESKGASGNPYSKSKKDERTAEEKEHEEATKVKNIQKIQIGKWEMDTWYYSPFPPEYAECSKLFICEFCLKFLRSYESLQRHMKRCNLSHPPGVEVYRKGNVSVFEIDGARNRIYCQNICYIAKLFLDHKTLYYDVNPFWFYVMCEIDDVGAHIVGYFSKEKHSDEDYNVACILTLPSHQRKGYGKFLIDFSYELSKIEQKPGSPEKPLSDLGLLSYRSYWSQILVDLLRNEKSASAMSIQEISDRTMMKTEDIIATLQVLDIIQYYEGQHIIDLRRVNNLKLGSRGLPCDPAYIQWTPKTNDNGRRR